MFLLTLTLVGSVLLYTFDGHTIVKEAVVTRYRKFRKVNKLVETQYKSIGMIIYVSICMIAKMYWMNFLQWSNRSVKKVDKNTITISYVFNGRLYTFVSSVKRGPKKIVAVVDHDNLDVTTDVLPFLGPNEDFHDINISPAFFKKESLTLITEMGDEMTFVGSQTLNTTSPVTPMYTVEIEPTVREHAVR